ncbi:MAG: glutamate racemase [Eubacteriales bacterium]
MGNEKLPIGVLDSGVGGLTVVKEILQLMPLESVVYFGDSKRMPYGNRKEEEIIFLANKIIRFLENKGVKGILLACNTVSSQINKLKSRVPLFGIIEAGCLAVQERSPKKEIGLIATVATVQSKVYEYTMNQLDPTKKIISNDSRKLPKVINNQLEHKYLLNKHIRECIDPILQQGEIEDLILGCSHFPIIQNEIQAIYPNLKLINPANKQVFMIKKYLEENNLYTKGKSRSHIEILTTEGVQEFKLTLQRLHIQDYTIERVELLKEDDDGNHHR